MSDKKIKIVGSVEDLMNELGVKPGETIHIRTPQFEREYDLEIKFIPESIDELQAIINHTPRDVLKKMGIGIWAKGEDGDEPHLKEDEVQYLFPGEWYKHLPNGFEVVGISGDKYKFEQGVSDDDIRYGCLPYGFIRKEAKTVQPEAGSQKSDK